jgi:hypothetical protein
MTHILAKKRETRPKIFCPKAVPEVLGFHQDCETIRHVDKYKQRCARRKTRQQSIILFLTRKISQRSCILSVESDSNFLLSNAAHVEEFENLRAFVYRLMWLCRDITLDEPSRVRVIHLSCLPPPSPSLSSLPSPLRHLLQWLSFTNEASLPWSLTCVTKV